MERTKSHLDLFHDAVSRLACGGDKDGDGDRDGDEDGGGSGRGVEGAGRGQVDRHRHWDHHWLFLHFI